MNPLIKLPILLLTAVIVTVGTGMADTSPDPIPTEGRRLEVLFLGSNPGSHKPRIRFRTIRRTLGVKGINFTYANEPTALTRANLARYDALLVYGNHDKITKDQESALLDYSRNGGACVFLHSACGCFRNSDAYVKLLGAQFKSHGRGVFRVTTVNPDHPVMKGFPGFECWDETYVHWKHNPDRTMLQKRDQEPWTWVRTHGKGRIFYTASGHDERCWQLPEYQDLVLRGILWTVGDKKASLIKKLNLPKLEYFKSSVPIIPGKNWGPPQDRKVPGTHLQKSLPVKESLKLSQIPVGFELQVFAAEPDIVNPISLNWDEHGRLWAVEAFDYPNNFTQGLPGKDQIKILEDTDNDGKADKISTFAKGLTICTTVLPVKNGCITTDGEEMVQLTDTDGDGVADHRRVIFKGISLADTHACTSNLRHGFDGWIYATVGYSGINTTVAGKNWKFRQGVFRFKQDGSDFEFIQGTTNNTWGLGFTEQGDITGSTANNNPSWYVGIPSRHYDGTGVKQPRTPRADSIDQIAPLTWDTLQVDCRGGITAGAGHAIYTARQFPKDWWNQRVLICAPTVKLIAAPRIEPRGRGFKTFEFDQNLYASADACSAPVAAEVGPDGAVWVADWYNAVLQHNVFTKGQKRGKGNAHVNTHRDRQHGRIYRIAPADMKPSPYPDLNTSAGCVAALAHDNLFWRLTAQRTLLENKSTDAIPDLYALAGKQQADSSLHALHALKLLGGGGKEKFQKLLIQCLKSNDRGIVQSALELLERNLRHLQAITALCDHPAPLIQKHAILYLAGLPASEQAGKVIATRLLAGKSNDAMQLAAHRHRDYVLAHLLSTPSAPQANQPLNAFFSSLKTVLERDKNYLSTQTIAALAKHPARYARELVDITGAPEIANAKPLSESAKRGQKVYGLVCIACHQPNGQGLEKTFPPLAGSEWLAGSPDKAIKIVLKGLTGPITVKGKKFNAIMPPQEAQLSDQQIADALNYVRNSWGNAHGDIPEAAVTRIRAQSENRKTLFTAKDFKDAPRHP